MQLGWCNVNGVLIIFVRFVFFYNMVAIIAIEYPSGILSPRTAMFGTLIASIILVRLFHFGAYV